MPVSKPNIYEYIDYRKFLKDYYAYKKEKKPGFSTRIFAKQAGFGSHSYLRMVISGKRNASLKSLKKIVKAIGFNEKEASFFTALALYNQATNEKDRDYYFDKLIGLKPSKKLHKLEKDKFAYFTKKSLVILRELVALPHFQEDPKWISDVLGNVLSPNDVAKAIKILLRLNLLERDAAGKLKQAKGTIESPVDAESLEIVNYHRSIISYVRNILTEVDHTKREIISITIPMADDMLPEIKDIMRRCRDEVVSYINKKHKNFDEVYQVNMQMIPVTWSRKDKK